MVGANRENLSFYHWYRLKSCCWLMLKIWILGWWLCDIWDWWELRCWKSLFLEEYEIGRCWFSWRRWVREAIGQRWRKDKSRRMVLRREGCVGLNLVWFFHLDLKIETTHTDGKRVDKYRWFLFWDIYMKNKKNYNLKLNLNLIESTMKN